MFLRGISPVPGYGQIILSSNHVRITNLYLMIQLDLPILTLLFFSKDILLSEAVLALTRLVERISWCVRAYAYVCVHAL